VRRLSVSQNAVLGIMQIRCSFTSLEWLGKGGGFLLMRTDGGSNKQVGVPHITKAGQQLSCQRGEQATGDKRQAREVKSKAKRAF
jgi:hypothetical protein